MKKIAVLLVIILAVSCKSGSEKGSKPLFEVLTQQTQGGAQVRFFEILTESREIKMLLNDENLKKKIKEDDTNTSNFIILNSGEKPSSGYAITVDKVEETATQIIVTVRETTPAPGDMSLTVMTYPYTIVRINSKKEIVIR